MNFRIPSFAINQFLILFFITCIVSKSQSQEYAKVEYADGTKYTISNFDNNDRNFPKHELFAGGFTYGGLTSFGGYTFTNPFAQQFKVEVGINGFSINTSYMLSSRVKEKTQKLDLGRRDGGMGVTPSGVGDIVNVYRGELPIYKVTSLGIGGGFEYFQIRENDLYESDFEFNANAISFGFVRVTTKHLSYTIRKQSFRDRTEKKRRSYASKLFIGVVYINPDFISVAPDPELELKSFVPRITYEYSMSLFASGKTGARFMIGFQGAYDSTIENGSILVGLGLRRTIG